MLLTNTDPDPWAGLPITLWRNNDLDPRSFAQREALVEHSAKEFKAAAASEFGRLYGLASQMYDMRRREKLESRLKRQVITPPPW